MREIKRLKLQFVMSSMAMVTMVLIFAFAAISFFIVKKMERNDTLLLEQVISRDALPPIFAGSEDMRVPYFMVFVDEGRHITLLEGRYNSFQDGEFLEKLARASISKGGEFGRMEDYGLRFVKKTMDGGHLIAYLDTTLEDAMADDMTRTLALIGVVVWLCFFGLSCALSKRMVRPIEESIRREKKFVADASHELKTPLTIIMANAELLVSQGASEEKGGENTPGLLAAGEADRIRWLYNIRQEAGQMKHLVEEMLILSKSESSRERARILPVHLSDVAIETVLSFESLFYQMNLELNSSIEEELYVKGDEAQLHQLMRILLDNAAKYTPPGGTVTVCLNRAGRGRVRLGVRNTGNEIPREKQKEIFDRFCQADEARASGGCGLGLAIAKNIVSSCHGEIGVNSGCGENEFFVVLKLCKAPAKN